MLSRKVDTRVARRTAIAGVQVFPAAKAS